MTKVYCDICGKEVRGVHETWTHVLTANKNNSRVSFDEVLPEICEHCATIIHCCISLMKAGVEPNLEPMPEKMKEEPDE